ncbi:MAG: hypothetical protein PHV68_09260 [Candidatus Gastranaerophilales bacterium]|nr:hypothetical protein [Candidatus Gastranaerophilales bacterium]
MKINSVQTQKINSTKPNKTVATSVPLRGDAKDTLELSFGQASKIVTDALKNKRSGYKLYDVATGLASGLLKPTKDDAILLKSAANDKNNIWADYIKNNILNEKAIQSLMAN